MAGFRLHLRETGDRRRIRNTDQTLASRTLNLPPGMARVALQRLIAVGTVEFEFVLTHKIHSTHA